MKKQNNLSITIGHLYGDLMNIYGDNGNIITLKKRCEWRGIECNVKNISLNEPIQKGDVDLYFFGGGQDQSQIEVANDLVKSDKADVIRADIERGVPLLSICGGYQLLGEYYKPHKGPKLAGIGVFAAYTDASFDRMIGNLVISSSFMVHDKEAQNNSTMNYDPITMNSLVGFENHSGKTFLRKGAKPLGKVISGFGNNGEDGYEGCRYKNAIGCYMHGSLLPKNPQLTDWLIEKALETKYGEKIELEELDDELETKAHDFAVSRFSKP